jgi:uncharacterized protein (TIGR02466 family)
MNLVQIFSTPIWQTEIPDFTEKKEIWLNDVKEFIKQNPESVSVSNVGGYHSHTNLHTVPELRNLFNFICEGAKKACDDLCFKPDTFVYITESWVNVSNDRKSYHKEHVHGEVFSGVFYLKSPLESGRLYIKNSGLNQMWNVKHLIDNKTPSTAEAISIDPVEGFLFIWPSYVPHWVEQNNHDDERISISFNITVTNEEL